ncbi:MAG TPA: family 16 glycoside hydrolase [Anaerolineales bacterium]|nr:family 16 glycoside hydrolase [Anaerolineales bacterium]
MRHLHTVRSLMRVTAVLAAVSLACGLPGRAALTATPTPAQPTPSPDSWGEELPPPPPAGLVDALQSKVEAGEMSQEQALVSGLQILAGAVELETVLDEAPVTLEGTGVVLDAQNYLRTGEDEAAKAEIERLLEVLAPRPETLLPYSSPEGSSLRPAAGLASPTFQQDCSDLFAGGFPQGSSAQCFQYKETTVGSTTIQIFYPTEDQPEGFTTAYADAALQATLDSLDTFSALKLPGRAVVMKDIEVVFSLLDTSSGTTLAMVPSDPGQNPCQIILFPLAIVHNEQEMENVAPSTGGPPAATAVFQQDVAHEVFHCFQIWNFPALAQNALWGVQDWWGEATATYFANVVYPTVDEEWMWIQSWAYNSAVTPLVYMSYDNFGFFQYVANRIGDEGLLRLIDSLTPAWAGDESAQAAQLAQFPEIQALFEDYALAFMDGTIADTSGEVIPTAPAYIPSLFRIDSSGDAVVPFGSPPFTLTRYGLTLGSAGAYQLDPMLADSPGRATLRPVPEVGQWTDIPTEVRGSCDTQRYYLVMANASESAGSLGLTVTADEPLDCGFTPTPPPAEGEPTQPIAADCPIGFAEAGSTYGYECVDGDLRAWIDNDQVPYDFITAPFGQEYGDVRIEADVLINSTEEEPFGGAIFVCRGAQTFGFFYAFTLAPDGSAQISDYLDGGEQIARFGSLPEGTMKANDWNHVRVDCIGNHMAIYVNGELAVDRDMDSLPRGDIGVGAGGASDGFVEVFFRNVVVSVP